MTSRIIIVLFLLVCFASPAITAETEQDKLFNGSVPPSESYLQENTVKKPTTRMAAPDEDGDGDDQKLTPLGAVDYITIAFLLLLCGSYFQYKTKQQ